MPRKEDYEPTRYKGIKKRKKDGKYSVVLDLGIQPVKSRKTGNIHMSHKTTERIFDNISDARAAQVQNEQCKRDKKVPYQNQHVTFNAGLDDFITKEGQFWKDSYRLHIMNHIRHFREFFGKMYICDLSVQAVYDYFTYLQGYGNMATGKGKKTEGISPNTYPKHKTSLRKVFEFFLNNDVYYGYPKEFNLADRVDLKARYDKIPVIRKSLSLEEVNITLNDIICNEPDRSIAVLFALGAIGGLRRGEIAGLQYKDFYYSENLMYIHNSKIDLNGKDKEKLPKNEKVRYAAVPQVLKDIINFETEQRKKILGIDEIQGEDYVFRPVNCLMEDRLPRACKINKKCNEYESRRNKRLKAQGMEGIESIRVHDLRHTHSNLLKSSVPFYMISYNMGHSLHYNTTTNIYFNDKGHERGEILSFFDNEIKPDWGRCKKPLGRGDFHKNGSGHYIVKE